MGELEVWKERAANTSREHIVLIAENRQDIRDLNVALEALEKGTPAALAARLKELAADQAVLSGRLNLARKERDALAERVAEMEERLRGEWVLPCQVAKYDVKTIHPVDDITESHS